MLFKVYSDFFMYKSGIYSKYKNTPDYPFSYHAVKVVGFGQERNIDYWVTNLKIWKLEENIFYSSFLNYQSAAKSWGINWGEVI